MKRWLRNVTSLKRFLLDFRQSAAFRNSRLNFLERKIGKAKLSSRPIVLQFEFTNACNLSCASCGHSYWDSKLNRPQLLTLEILEKIQFLYESASEVLIGGYGEPTLHPEFGKLFQWLRRDPHKKISMITHGLKIPEVWEKMGGLNSLIISIDGVGEVYEKHRGVPFQRLVETLDFLKSRMDAELSLEVNMVWNESTHGTLAKLVEFLEPYGVKAIHLLPEKMYSKARYEEGLFHPQKLHDLYVSLQKSQKKTRIRLDYPAFLAHTVDCNQPFETLFILSSGEVLGCCSAIFHGNDYRFSLGDVSDLSKNFSRVWNQDKMVQFRSAFHGTGEKQYPKPCQTCAFRVLRHDNLMRSLS